MTPLPFTFVFVFWLSFPVNGNGQTSFLPDGLAVEQRGMRVYSNNRQVAYRNLTVLFNRYEESAEAFRRFQQQRTNLRLLRLAATASSAVVCIQSRNLAVLLSTFLADGLFALLHINFREKAIRHLGRATAYYNQRSTYDFLYPVK